MPIKQTTFTPIASGAQAGPRIIPLFALANSSSAVHTVVGYAGFNPATYSVTGRTTALALDVIGQVSGPGLTGWVELVDASDVAVASLSWTETVATRKTIVPVMPVPTQIYRARVWCVGVVDPLTDYALFGGANLEITWS